MAKAVGSSNGNGAFKQEALTINGIKTVVLTAGQGDPLVFFHGAGVAPGFDFALPWAKRFKVIIPFHPGFGGSGDDPELSEMHDFVLHYIELFDHLGLNGNVRLVGFSLGGWLASEFAIEHRRRIAKLVLVAPAGLRDPEHPSTDIFRIPPDELPSYLACDVNVVLRHMPKEPNADFLAERYREMTTTARIAWEHPFSSRLPRWLHRVNVPTMLLWGEQDRLIPHQQAKSWASLIPGAKIRLLKNAGHLVLHENPEAAGLVADFLA